MLYYKFVGTSGLDLKEGETCAEGRCPDFRVQVLSGNKNDVDCRERLYGPSLNMTKVSSLKCRFTRFKFCSRETLKHKIFLNKVNA